MYYDAAIVIPIHNEQNGISATLDSFREQITNRFLLVTVDNNSTDGTVELLQRWQRTNSNTPHIILTEPRRGSMYARRKGLLYAKDYAPVVISTDADNTPRQGFAEDITAFAQNTTQDVLVGHQQQDPYARLLKQLYLPTLMDAIAWMEELEKELFGPFFFGGYFGIKSTKITPKIFSSSRIAIPTEPSVLWSKHCYYSKYTFGYSRKTMQTSSRRFWADAKGFFSLQHKKIIRSNSSPSPEDIQRLVNLKQQEDTLIAVRLDHFAQRLLLLLLDAVFFEKQTPDKSVVDGVITDVSNFLDIHVNEVRKTATLSFAKARTTLLASYKSSALDVIRSRYYNSLEDSPK